MLHIRAKKFLQMLRGMHCLCAFSQLGAMDMSSRKPMSVMLCAQVRLPHSHAPVEAYYPGVNVQIKFVRLVQIRSVHNCLCGLFIYNKCTHTRSQAHTHTQIHIQKPSKINLYLIVLYLCQRRLRKVTISFSFDIYVVSMLFLVFYTSTYIF